MTHKEIPVTHNSIKSFWFTERSFIGTENMFQILPDGHVELIFFFNAVCSLHLSQTESVQLFSPFIVGLLDKPLLLQITGHIYIYAVRLYPWSAFSFLNISPATNESIMLQNTIFQTLTDKLKEQAAQKQPADVLLWLQHYFLQQVLPVSSEDPTVSAVAQSIIEQDEMLSFKSLANKHKTTPRTLQRRFLRCTGNSAKSFAGKVRFEKVRNIIWFHPDCNFTQLAYEYGFTDQAHFNHEFKRFCGKTPGEFAKEALKAK